VEFRDFSNRQPTDVKETGDDPPVVTPVTWDAKLYPAIWDGTSTEVEVRDGVSWGWNMKKATVGSTTGTFVNPTPATAVVSGVGTNAFSWGVSSDPSSVAFVGEAFDTEPRTPFTLGRLTFHNGVIDTGTGADGVDFNVAISFDNVAGENFVLTTAFAINNTLNTSDPNASADFLSIGDFGFTFHVLENATASVDVIGMLTTGLDAIASGTDMPSGADLFSTGPFDPTGGYMLSIVGLSDPSSGGFVRRVPEPSTITLCALGLVALFLLGRGRNARRGSA
jgi:hypothetical protein